MFTHTQQCPHCNATVTDWSARCPKCRYHPDCDDRDCYNRAEDDVAILARYVTTANEPNEPTSVGRAWRRLLPAWAHRHGAHSA